MVVIDVTRAFFVSESASINTSDGTENPRSALCAVDVASQLMRGSLEDETGQPPRKERKIGNIWLKQHLNILNTCFYVLIGWL